MNADDRPEQLYAEARKISDEMDNFCEGCVQCIGYCTPEDESCVSHQDYEDLEEELVSILREVDCEEVA